jgi:predicted dinucleotide-binding enzyme
MKIGVIGSGKIGGTAARLFVQAGHEVAISNSRGPASLAALIRELGPRTHAMTVEEAASFGDILLVAIPFGKYTALPVPQLAGKIVIDSMNYYPRRDGEIDLGGLTSSELVARYLRGARLVKAFNTMYFHTLASEGRPGGPPGDRLVMFVAGDDAGAKAQVLRLVEEIGFAPLDTGSLHEGGRQQEPGSPIYNRPLTLAQARELLAGAQ